MPEAQPIVSPSTSTGATEPDATLHSEQEPEQETSAPDETASTSDAIAAPDSAPSRAQARIEEQAAEKLALREAAEYWRTRALAAPEQKPTPVVVEQAPKFADFESADDWAAAHAEFVEKRAEAKAQTAAEKRLETERTQLAAEATRTVFEDRASTFRVKNPNFDAVVGNPRLPITTVMTEVIQQSEKGPELAYHLGLHPDQAARIAMLKSPAQQAAALGRLEATLASTPTPAIPKKGTTRAPPPPTPVGSGQPSKDIGDMSIDEYMAHRARGRKVIS